MTLGARSTSASALLTGMTVTHSCELVSVAVLACCCYFLSFCCVAVAAVWGPKLLEVGSGMDGVASVVLCCCCGGCCLFLALLLLLLCVG